MTPMETAERIASAHMRKDNPLYESLVSAITAAIQAASNAQLDRDRAVIEAAKKAARIHRDAWDHRAGQEGDVTPTEAIDYLETHQLDLIRAETRELDGTISHFWVVMSGATEVAKGETILESVANAKLKMEHKL